VPLKYFCTNEEIIIAEYSDNPENIPITDPNRLRQLEKELREAKEEIEILQDALVFFVKRRKK
jgi:transposase-like protein